MVVDAKEDLLSTLQTAADFTLVKSSEVKRDSGARQWREQPGSKGYVQFSLVKKRITLVKTMNRQLKLLPIRSSRCSSFQLKKKTLFIQIGGNFKTTQSSCEYTHTHSHTLTAL